MEAAYVTKCQWERGPCGTIDSFGKLDFHNIRGLHSPSVRLKNKAENPNFWHREAAMWRRIWLEKGSSIEHEKKSSRLKLSRLEIRIPAAGSSLYDFYVPLFYPTFLHLILVVRL